MRFFRCSLLPFIVVITIFFKSNIIVCNNLEDPSPSIKFAKGIWFLKNSNEKEGLTLLEESCFSDYLPACYELYDYYYKKRELESALDYINQIISLEENPPSKILKLHVLLCLNTGEYPVAIRSLKQLEQMGEDVSLEYGITLFLLGEKKDAESYLKKALSKEGGEREITARLYLSQIYMEEKDVDSALDTILPAVKKLALISSPKLKEKVKEISNTIFASFPYLPLGLSGNLKLSFGYNTNPIYEPLQAKTESGSPIVDIEGILSLEPFGNYHYVVGDTLQLTRKQYIFEKAQNFNLSLLNNTLYLRTNFFLGLLHELTLDYKTVILMLDGGELLEENYPYLFMESHSGRLNLTIYERSSLFTRIGLEVGGRFFHNKGRSGKFFTLKLGQSIFLLNKKLKIYVEGNLNLMNSKTPSYSYISPQFSFALSWLLPFLDIELLNSETVQWFDYYNSKGFFDPIHLEKERKELWFIGNIGLLRRYYKYYRSGIIYQFSIVNSTIEDFSYMQHLIYFQLEAGF